MFNESSCIDARDVQAGYIILPESDAVDVLNRQLCRLDVLITQ